MGIPWETSCWNLLTVTPQEPEDPPGSLSMILYLLKSHLFLPIHLSMAGNHFHRYKIYFIFYSHNLVAKVTVLYQFCPKFDDIWNKGSQKFPEDERREDRGRFKPLRSERWRKLIKLTLFTHFSDLDSAVSSGGLDQILAPPAGKTQKQPKSRSFFQSVTVTKVVKPDGVRSNKWLLVQLLDII